MSEPKVLKYHPEKGWVSVEEYERDKLIDDIIDRISSDLELEIRIDLKSGEGKITMKRKEPRKTT